jgi:lipopolysaccharide biosynthesis protein
MQSDGFPKIAVFAHLYYPESVDDFILHLKDISIYKPDFYFNLGPSSNRELQIKKIRTHFPKAYILDSPNIGKDVGGKLALLELYRILNLQSDYMLFIHDKQSPQVIHGEKWKNELLEILKINEIKQVISIFESEPKVGIIGSLKHISNEYDVKNKKFNTKNDTILRECIGKFKFTAEEFLFIAGNMFWVRAPIFERFFKENNPLILRSGLEEGNVLDTESGTYTHSLERVFSWIALNQGFSIRGI